MEGLWIKLRVNLIMDNWKIWIVFTAILSYHTSLGQDNNNTALKFDANFTTEAPKPLPANSTVTVQPETDTNATAQAETTQNGTTQSVETTPQPPSTGEGKQNASDYMLFTPKDKFPCFRAMFNASILVKYYDTKADLKEHLTNITNNATFDGQCGTNITTFTLSWKGIGPVNNSHTLRFTFLTKGPTDGDAIPMKTWLAGPITLTLQKEVLESPNTDADVITLTTEENETHFQTPGGRSYDCKGTVKISLRDYRNGANQDPSTDVVEEATLDIWDARIQPFELKTGGEYSAASSCELDILEANNQPKHIVPVVIISVLCAIILIMVVTYYFMKRRSKSSYTAM